MHECVLIVYVRYILHAMVVISKQTVMNSGSFVGTYLRVRGFVAAVFRTGNKIVLKRCDSYCVFAHVISLTLRDQSNIPLEWTNCCIVKHLLECKNYE